MDRPDLTQPYWWKMPITGPLLEFIYAPAVTMGILTIWWLSIPVILTVRPSLVATTRTASSGWVSETNPHLEDKSGPCSGTLAWQWNPPKKRHLAKNRAALSWFVLPETQSFSFNLLQLMTFTAYSLPSGLDLGVVVQTVPDDPFFANCEWVKLPFNADFNISFCQAVVSGSWR